MLRITFLFFWRRTKKFRKQSVSEYGWHYYLKMTVDGNQLTKLCHLGSPYPQNYSYLVYVNYSVIYVIAQVTWCMLTTMVQSVTITDADWYSNLLFWSGEKRFSFNETKSKERSKWRTREISLPVEPTWSPVFLQGTEQLPTLSNVLPRSDLWVLRRLQSLRCLNVEITVR